MNTLNRNSLDIFAHNDGSLVKFDYEKYINSRQPASLFDVKFTAKTNKKNYFLPDQYFTKLYFSHSINNIDYATFDLIQYLPSIITDIQDVNYFDSTTYINNNSIIQNGIHNNVANANEIQTFKLTCNDIKSNNIKTDSINTKQLVIQNKIFNDTVGYIYINHFSLPIDENEYLFRDYNLLITSDIYITIKPRVKIFIYDINNVLIYFLYNDTDKYKYMTNLNYNINYYKIVVKY